ncbi:LexA family protein [Gimesia maris]|uniref:LexA family protein n=1 Tax=Gimesia maris TaxID=122 RepID=UPI0012B6DC1F|nr:LexA family transcriptional regulator [Gimesia maris]
MKRLTDKQKSILSFIRVYCAKVGEVPTVREIGAAFGIRSTNGVSDHLKALQRKRRLRIMGTMPRGLEVVKNMRLRFCGGVS